MSLSFYLCDPVSFIRVADKSLVQDRPPDHCYTTEENASRSLPSTINYLQILRKEWGPMSPSTIDGRALMVFILYRPYAGSHKYFVFNKNKDGEGCPYPLGSSEECERPVEAASGGVVTGKESAEPTSPRTSKSVGGMGWGAVKCYGKMVLKSGVAKLKEKRQNRASQRRMTNLYSSLLYLSQQASSTRVVPSESWGWRH